MSAKTCPVPLPPTLRQKQSSKRASKRNLAGADNRSSSRTCRRSCGATCRSTMSRASSSGVSTGASLKAFVCFCSSAEGMYPLFALIFRSAEFDRSNQSRWNVCYIQLMEQAPSAQFGVSLELYGSGAWKQSTRFQHSLYIPFASFQLSRRVAASAFGTEKFCHG